jgi:RNA polymerase sigma factor (sigma-70 family)
VTGGRHSGRPYSPRMSTAIDLMLASASRHPIPSKAEQLHLGTLIQRGLQPDATAREKRAGDRARRRLVMGNFRLAVSVAKNYRKRLQSTAAMELSDLIQEGAIALDTAARKYDPTRGFAFSTYATWWIRQGVARAITMQASTIRIPSHQTDVLRRWRFRPHGQSLADFCEQWNYELAKVTDVVRLEWQATVHSLDAPVRGAETSDLQGFLADPNSEPSTEALDLELAVARLEAAGAPEDLELVLASLGNTTPALAAQMGCDRGTMASRLKGARQRLAAVAGNEARELVAAA